MTKEEIATAREHIVKSMSPEWKPTIAGRQAVRDLDALCKAAQRRVKSSPFDQTGADRLANEVNSLVRRGVIDARSPASDALLDYASGRFGDSDPIGDLERETENGRERQSVGFACPEHPDRQAALEEVLVKLYRYQDGELNWLEIVEDINKLRRLEGTS